MNQFFMGVKPGVGPVLKVLRYDDDDALTLANDAYDRYYFNSENQNLSYTFTIEPFTSSYSSLSALPENFDLYDNRISGTRFVSSSTYYQSEIYYRISKAFPELTYPPIHELRIKDLNTGRIAAGRRSLYLVYRPTIGGSGWVESYQFRGVDLLAPTMFRVTGYQATPTQPRTGKLENRFSRIGLGEWCVQAKNLYLQSQGVGGPTTTYAQIWDLPADASPMRSYTYQPGLLSWVMNGAEVKLSRPGYSVYDTGVQTHIIDTDRSPALCIIAGQALNVPTNGSVTLSAPPGVAISETAVTEFMYRKVGQPWYVPGFTPGGYVVDSHFDLSYKIVDNQVVIYNEGTDAVDIRYVVFNVDREPASTGGSLVMFSGNDGERNYIQIKKPGTSDPASKPNDILLDTRFPSFQIIKEGYLPLSAFVDAPSGEKPWFGNKKASISFENNGFLPYLKFSVVYPDCVTSPYTCVAYTDPGGGASFGPPSNSSVPARVEDNKITWWMSPGNWSRRVNESGTVKYYYDLPDPIGVRYYIFGIAQ